MQLIQWYPGHMHKANKEIRQSLPLVDLVIEVLDARIPFSSENPLLAQIRGDKPCIKVLAKSDLADPQRTALWQQYLEQHKGVRTLALSTHAPEGYAALPDLCRKMVPLKVGSDKDIIAMIVGIPNVGKSTLINRLAGRNIAKTGNEPAVTKRQQRIRIDDGIMLFDTPGVLWPNLENRNSGYRLAVTGAIKDTAISHDDIALWAVEFFLRTVPQTLQQRYGLERLEDSPLSVMEAIGARRGCLVGGGHVDYDKVAKILLNELRSGQLGPLTLETPDEMEHELLETARLRLEKAEQKQQRKTQRKQKSR